MPKLTPKDVSKAVVLGAGVLAGAPLLSGLISGIEFLAYEIPFIGMTLGGVIAGGLVAFLIMLGMEKYWK